MFSYYTFQKTYNKGADYPALMDYAFGARIQQKQGFFWCCSR